MAVPQERWECPNCGTPLNIAALGIYAKVACPACGHIDHVHTMLANFRIEGVLGLGGMSVVLRARDLVLERPLAIKLLNEFYRDQPERIARFEQECELMAKVRHENVVSLYSAGRVKGQFYIAMELVHGRNLEEMVREEGPMEPLRALDLINQVVQGLHAAYKSGLLHRDMKPANILICEDGTAKVLDFGLSHGRRDADTEEIIWATPFYVPPETLQREPEDTRTDIYALGMTLRHLLTGQENFDPVPTDIDEMLACKQALPPMAEVMPDLPEAYCDLIDHMTAYEPDNRPEGYVSLQVEIAEVRAALVAERRTASLLGRLKGALPVFAGVAGTLAVGALAAYIVACIVTPEPQLQYITPPASLSWQERDSLASAMECLQLGKLEEAEKHFETLAESEGEPTACAWAALHARALSILLGHAEDDGSLHLLDCLERHLSRTPAPAGAAVHAQMSSLSQQNAAPAEKFLQAYLSLQRAEEKCPLCRDAEVKRDLQAARAVLRAEGQNYVAMVNALIRYESALVSSLPARAAALYCRSLGEADMPEARRALSLMLSAAKDDESRARLAVQQEALTLFNDAVEMMKRRSLLPPADKTLTPEQLASALVPLGDSQLVDELPVLLLMAQGKFGEASLHNPYAKSPDSSEAFAVLMRDWLTRAKMQPGKAEATKPQQAASGEWAEYADIED